MTTWFITGANGFIGQEVLKRLTANGEKIIALTFPGASTPEFPQVEWVEGNITHPEIISDPKVRQRVLDETQAVLHLAALYDIKASHKDLYLANVTGTSNLLMFCEQIKQLKVFHYASTIAVAGDFKGTLTENQFEVRQNFSDSYASTKYAAEKAVRDWVHPVAKIVHRFGIIVGDHKTGYMPKIDGPYYLLNSLKRHRSALKKLGILGYLPIPFDEHTRMYFVPVDVLADALVELMRASYDPQLYTFHLTGDAGGIPIRVVIREVFKAAGLTPRFFSVGDSILIQKACNTLGVPPQSISYMKSRVRFDNTAFKTKLPNFKFPDFEAYASTIFGENHSGDDK